MDFLGRPEGVALLLISLIGIGFAWMLVKNLRSPDPYYTIRGARFHKVVAPKWFYAFTAFYLMVALAMILAPVVWVWAL